ncbi:uncharacterized protein LOC110906580 [Helianthus annuus]|uniref:uncharacterized protein LOC110906577 n=1 Tax=Helianthus annuus TaxID=4232 RepID=UPI000B8FC94E|nr:uncharacterized protein LOC110906577 [Helianthus annuus]XP_022007383.1 uncharacterized protein LOC110906580 [Helianthus annuus]
MKLFLKIAQEDRVKKGNELVPCPCMECKNFTDFKDIRDIEYHLLRNGFMFNYTCWSKHGESLANRSTTSINLGSNYNDENNAPHIRDDIDNLNEGYDNINEVNDNLNDMRDDLEANADDSDLEKLQQLFADEEKPLYVGCTKFSKLSAVLKLFNLKTNYSWSDKSFTCLLELLHDMLPTDNELPISVYQAKKLMCPMELEVERIHACPNDCMLYRNQYEKAHTCITCGESRYKRKNETNDYDDDVMKNGPPAKLLWYFPIIPRLKRLFANPKGSKLLRWHSEERKDDGKLRHVADSPQWRNFDYDYPDFGNEVRNIRFGLSSDGINPFGNMSSRHSTWPVLLCIYNLPPCLCMKRKYIMMSLLIQGPKQPGNDIDVYLSPLIDDLKTLWSPGVDMYDAYEKTNFKLRAMIFCTISDFPAYANLSGYSTKGKLAYPVCENETSSIRLKHCKKTVYMGHRRFLPRDHYYRRLTEEFDGNEELGRARKGFDAFSRVENMNTVLGKRSSTETRDNWKKRSIFWDLPYWKSLEVRHYLDVMHIEKNVCDSLLGLLLNIPGKTKDGINVRKDMEEMGIRKDLAPVERAKSIYLPPACYTMSREEKRKFCQCLHDIKVPSSYSANIKRLVSMKECKLLGMKSHDCHVLMTHMIPIAIRGLLPKEVRHTITKLCLFFNMIHSKVIDPEVLDSWEKDIYITLCELEMYFPPSFFDIMVHLVSHIVKEIKSCGPVFLRYMYPFERYMGVLKGYVRNTNRPEGSIVQGYTSEEATEFCTGYLEGVKSIGVPKSRHSGRLAGVGGVGKRLITPPPDEIKIAHFTVLQHMTCIAPYVNEHKRILRSTHLHKSDNWYTKQHNEGFCDWLKKKVEETYGEPNVDKTVEKLGMGPDFRVISYQGYDINGYTFYTKKQDDKTATQNSGVTQIASSTKGDKMIIAKESYYGVIQEIWELSYDSFTIPLFRLLQGKRRILGVDDVDDEEEYNQFDELPPFSVGIQQGNDYITIGTSYLRRSDHDDGISIEKPTQTKKSKDKQ